MTVYKGWISGLILGLSSPAMAADLLVQTRLVPATIRVGQPIHYEVDVLTDTWLTGAAEFPVFQTPGLLISFEGSQGRSIQRIIEGKRYFGVTYRYRLIPLEAGVMVLPEYRLKAPVGREELPVSALVPEQAFAVQPLPEPAASSVKLLAGDVRLSQSLIPIDGQRVPGQPLIREVRVHATQAQTLAIPALAQHPDDRLLTGQPLPPELSSVTDPRGHVIGGQRIDRTRYLPERTGTYRLPALSLQWWDIDEGRVKQSTLPPLEIQVVASEPVHPPWAWLALPIVVAALYITRGRKTGRTLWRILKNRSLNCLPHTRPGTRAHAVRQLKKQPPELTGFYQLIEHQNNAHSLQHSTLPAPMRKQLLSGLSGYYSHTPEPRRSSRSLIRLIRKLK